MICNLIITAVITAGLIPSPVLSEVQTQSPSGILSVEKTLEPEAIEARFYIQKAHTNEFRRYIATKKKPTVAPTTKLAVKPGVEQWRGLVAQYFPASQVNNALAIMSCESGGNPNAKSPTNDHGLFQVHNGLQWHGEKIYEPEYNVSLAYNSYFKPRGWQPWSCARKLGIR